MLASDVFESGAAVDRLLFGTLLGLGTGDLVLAAADGRLAALASLALGRTWSAIAFDPDGAPALGVPAARADFLLLALVAVAAVAALPAVGALLVAAVYVLPGAAARLSRARSQRCWHGRSRSPWPRACSGLYVAYWLDLPPGPPVAVLGALVYAVLALGAGLRDSRLRAATA